MATAIIEIVIGKIGEAVVGKLGEMAVEQVANQASLLLNFRKDFEWLQRNLTYVRGYLQDAEGLSIRSEVVKKWLADLQDIAFDAEDIVQEFVVQFVPSNCTHFAFNYKSIIFRYKMGKRIRKIKDRMKLIIKNANELKLARKVLRDGRAAEDWNKSAVQEWKKSGLIERDARPVAIDAKVERILHLLQESETQVIAVVGMGGIGKTFLLQNVYNHPKVREMFKKPIWLSISQVYSVARLQYDIASHLDLRKEVKGVSKELAAELIHKKLRDKSSLIVLDDVWRVEGVDNLMQRLGIPGGITNPCKVVVTTRSVEVCNIMGASQIYHMDLLSEQDSWNLFRLHAFPDDQQNMPSQELNEVARQVERECARLPLAIKTVAASMASQKELSTWKSKLQQLKEVSHLLDPIGPILRLSYDALPAVLKPCFLYFSFFGEDVEIDAEYLIYLWMGEGFIPEGKEQFSNGWSYLKQLNYLCLIEVKEDEELRSTCKIHDLLLDLIISISKENKCAFTVEEASAVGCRRILLAKKGLYDARIRELKCPKSLRTLSLSLNGVSKLPTESLTGVGAMRVIDLSYTRIFLLPTCIGNFKLLRVLNLSNTEFRFAQVPDCVKNLTSLWFLNVDQYSLPEWIGDLKCLQHLHVAHVDYSREISRGISKLVSLRTLRSRYFIGLVLKDVAKLIHLEELRIDITNEEEKRSLEEGILAELVNMRRLSVNAYNYFPKFPDRMKAMKALRVLQLQNCDLSQCAGLATMTNLTKLYLDGCGCRELPEFFGKSGAFPHLRSLEINCFDGVDVLEKLPDLQPGAMPRVEVFKVNNCKRLQKIPEGFEHLTSLKLLDLRFNMFTRGEEERLREGGEYWNKIKASNPHITIDI